MQWIVSALSFTGGSSGKIDSACVTAERIVPEIAPTGFFRIFLPRIAWLIALILVLSALAACGNVSPSTRVADKFFDAVSAEDAEAWKILLDPATREQFEAAMGDAELTAYLRDANKSLSEQYGSSWRGKVRILSTAVNPASAAATGNSWIVTVSINGDAGGKQDIPVLELNGQYWLDLSTMEMTGTVD